MVKKKTTSNKDIKEAICHLTYLVERASLKAGGENGVADCNKVYAKLKNITNKWED